MNWAEIITGLVYTFAAQLSQSFLKLIFANPCGIAHIFQNSDHVNY